MDYLTFTDGVLKFTYNEKDYTITSIDDWEAAVADIKTDPNYTEGSTSFMCSSSIDFPEESTDNQELIDLCYAIRST